MKDFTGGVAPRFEEITSNRLAIERGSLVAGKISFQIRNIASLLVSKVPNYGCLLILLAAMLGGIVGIALSIMMQNPAGLAIGVAGAIVIAVIALRDSFTPKYQLQLLTNAATSFRLINKDEQFLLDLKNAIEEVMQRSDNSVAYHVNIAEQKIDRLEANTTHVVGSHGAIVTGGNVTNATQSTNVTVQGLQDVDALLKIVQTTAAENREFFQYHLKIVQQHLSGARSKAEAKSSWEQFIRHVGLLAGSGQNVWELVARIGALLA